MLFRYPVAITVYHEGIYNAEVKYPIFYTAIMEKAIARHQKSDVPRYEWNVRYDSFVRGDGYYADKDLSILLLLWSTWFFLLLLWAMYRAKLSVVLINKAYTRFALHGSTFLVARFFHVPLRQLFTRHEVSNIFSPCAIKSSSGCFFSINFLPSRLFTTRLFCGFGFYLEMMTWE